MVGSVQSDLRVLTEQHHVDDEGVPLFVLAQVVQALRVERDGQGQNVQGFAAKRNVFGAEGLGFRAFCDCDEGLVELVHHAVHEPKVASG